MQIDRKEYMRKIFVLTALCFLPLYAFSQNSAKTESKSPLVGVNTSADTLQYSLGAYIGKWIRSNGFAVQNAEIFLKGMDDALKNKPLAVSDSSIDARITAYQLFTRSERRKQQEDQLFASLKDKPGIGALPDGVKYMVIKQGTGIRPLPKDTVILQAVGMFADGTIFEDTQKNRQPIRMLTSALIPGLNEVVQIMPEGSVWRIFIPAALAYGSAGLKGIIPPNTALVYDIALIQVKQSDK